MNGKWKKSFVWVNYCRPRQSIIIQINETFYWNDSVISTERGEMHVNKLLLLLIDKRRLRSTKHKLKNNKFGFKKIRPLI